MRRPSAALLVLLVLLVVGAPAGAADEASDLQKLTAENLRLRAALTQLQPELSRAQRWLAIYEAGVFTTALNPSQQQALQQEAAAIDDGWKALEAARRKVLRPNDGSLFNRQTLGFDDSPKEAK